MSDPIARPEAGEYAPFYERYVQAVPDGDLLSLLDAQRAEVRDIVAQMDEVQAGEPPAPGKWSVKDALQHMADTERVMAYRMLCVARGETTPLPGFDQDGYAAMAGAASRSLSGLLDDLAAVRGATLSLLRGLTTEALVRRGNANGSPVTARALAWIIAGHELHHLQLLRERYPAAPVIGA